MLVTNEIASVNAPVPLGDGQLTSGHFSSFLNQSWFPFHAGKSVSNSSEWDSAWKHLMDSSGLSSEEFFEFVRHCSLRFGYQAPKIL